MLAEDLFIVDATSPLWNAVRPLVEAVLRLEQNDDNYTWYGWTKSSLQTFLSSLSGHCSLMAGVWDEQAVEEKTGHEPLVLGCVCEVVEGVVRSIRTFDALAQADLPPTALLEPGYEHAQALMRAARAHVAPVAWALFTDKTTWDEWLFTTSNNRVELDKGEMLAAFVQQGRCVLMGSQTLQLHHHS